MNFLKGLAIAIYTLIFVSAGGILAALALNLISSDELMDAVNYIYNDPNVKLVLGGIGVIFILGGLISANISLNKMQMEKTIAFENPEGQVTVSLSAIEDFIRKSVRHFPEVKEMRSNVTASKKGINITCRATIFADSNIPAATERIQRIVKSTVHDMLGVEETINIKIHVTKISSRGKDETPITSSGHADVSRHIPFGVGE